MASLAPCFQFDDVEVRTAAFEVLKGGRSLPLEPKAIRLLVYLIENRERAVSKDELLQAVWDGATVTDNALTRVVAQLRKELGDDARNARYIQTVPTLGYRFVGEIAIRAPDAPPMPAAVAKHTSSNRWWVIVAAAVTVGCLGVSFAVWQALSTRAERPQLRGSVQFTTSPGLDLGATFSPDGKSLAYSSDRSGRFEIYVRALQDQARPVAITSDGKQNMEPAWSPDGRWIAFYSVARGGVCIVNAVGGEVRQVTQFGSNPAWSPDSKRIVFRSTGLFSVAPGDSLGAVNSTLWEISATGGAPRQLTKPGNPEGTHAFPAWTPSGREVVFTNVPLGRPGGLYTVNVDSGAVRKSISADENALLTPVFSPDRKSLYYTAISTARDFGIFRMPIDPQTGERTGDPVELARTGSATPRSPVVSPDGKQLAYTYSTITSQLWTVALKGGTAPRPLYRESVFRTIHPAFSPDGSRIAYIARRFGTKADLWVMNADGTDPSAISTEPSPEFLPSWSADGKSLFYTVQDKNRTQIWQQTLSGGLRQKLLDDAGAMGWARVEPNGAFVVYQTGQPLNVWRRDIRTGEARQLTFDKEGAGFPAVSANGRQVAVELLRGENTQLAIIETDGTQLRQLTNEPGHAWAHGWSPDGRRVVYAGFYEGAWNIYWIDTITRDRKKLTNFTSLDSYTRYPTWSPKNDQVVFELGETRGNIYTLDLR